MESEGGDTINQRTSNSLPAVVALELWPEEMESNDFGLEDKIEDLNTPKDVWEQSQSGR